MPGFQVQQECLTTRIGETPCVSTPELRHLQVKLGCKFSYQPAADILNEFLPEIESFNHATTRNRVLVVGKAIEAEMRAEIDAKPIAEQPAEHMIFGIDGTFVRATRSKNQRKHFEVVLGRIETAGRASEMFAAARDFHDLARERFRSALRKAGRSHRPGSPFCPMERTPCGSWPVNG
jgi:hypothetical protein